MRPPSTSPANGRAIRVTATSTTSRPARPRRRARPSWTNYPKTITSMLSSSMTGCGVTRTSSRAPTAPSMTPGTIGPATQSPTAPFAISSPQRTTSTQQLCPTLCSMPACRGTSRFPTSTHSGVSFPTLVTPTKSTSILATMTAIPTCGSLTPTTPTGRTTFSASSTRRSRRLTSTASTWTRWGTTGAQPTTTTGAIQLTWATASRPN